MIDLSLILLGIIVLFALFVVLRAKRVLRVCALCASSALTWLLLLVLFYMKNDTDPIIIGILAGGSIVGLMYFLEKRLEEKYHIFKLPYFLTLVAIIYMALAREWSMTGVYLVVIAVWIVCGALFLLRRGKGVRGAIKHIIQCCRNW